MSLLTQRMTSKRGQAVIHAAALAEV